VFLPWEILRPGCDADRSLPSSAEVKNEWRYTSAPHTPSWRVQGTILHSLKQQMPWTDFVFRSVHKPFVIKSGFRVVEKKKKSNYSQLDSFRE